MRCLPFRYVFVCVCVRACVNLNISNNLLLPDDFFRKIDVVNSRDLEQYLFCFSVFALTDEPTRRLGHKP